MYTRPPPTSLPFHRWKCRLATAKDILQPVTSLLETTIVMTTVKVKPTPTSPIPIRMSPNCTPRLRKNREQPSTSRCKIIRITQVLVISISDTDGYPRSEIPAPKLCHVTGTISLCAYSGHDTCLRLWLRTICY